MPVPALSEETSAAPCGWAVETGACAGLWETYTVQIRERAEAAAAMIMWANTGRRYGLCEITVQPSAAPRVDPLYRAYPVGPGNGLLSPVIDGGQWYNRYGGDTDRACCTTAHCEVALEGPTTLANIAAVSVDGVLVDVSRYVVMDGYLLVRTDGQCWPACVNYGAQSPPAFTVTYFRGLEIPAAVQGAFERLACELAKDAAGGACTLPQRMTRLTRQGVEIELDEVDVNETGPWLSGIKEVDDVIVAVNPYRLTAAPAVMSPDLPSPRRLT